MTTETTAAELADLLKRLDDSVAWLRHGKFAEESAFLSVAHIERIAALLRAGAAKVPDELVDRAWYWVRYEGITQTHEAPAMYKKDANAFYSLSFSGIPEPEIVVIRELTATPPDPDAGVVEPMPEFTDDDAGRKAFARGWNACHAQMTKGVSA